MTWVFTRGVDCARRFRLTLALVLLGGASCAKLSAQNAQYGVAMPLTLSAGFLDTARAQYTDPSAPQVFGGFRLLGTPEIRVTDSASDLARTTRCWRGKRSF